MAEEKKTAAPEAKPAAEPASPPAEKPEKGGKKMGFAVAAIAVVIGLFVLLIGGGMAFAAFMPASNSMVQTMAETPVLNMLVLPEKKGRVILHKKVDSLSETEELADFLNLEDDGKMALSGTVSGDATFGETDLDGVRADVEAAYNETGFEGDATINIDVGDSSYSAEADLAADSSTVYVKVTSISDEAKDYLMEELAAASGATVAQMEDFVDFDGAIGNWYKLGENDLGSAGMGDLDVFGEDVSEEEQDAIMKAFEDFLAEENAEYIGTETVRGTKAYHFEYDISAEEMADLAEDIAEAQDEEFDREEYLEDMEDLKSFVLGVWMDKDGNLVKLSVVLEMEDEDGKTTNVDLSIESWDQGSAQDVAIPSNAKDIEDIQEDIFTFPTTGYGSGGGPGSNF